ncbi:zinc finger transcription factor 1 [Mariannaea sp. PMI_226]|nr:zinc finger transcription factor 1 [Mariannaea sp. PMI_226]
MPRAFTRTPLACDSCRRRKTKCDGIHPRCKHCTSKKLQCIWSMPSLDTPATSALALTPESGDAATLVTEPSSAGEPPEGGLQICIDLFFERHFASDFCSFDSRPDFEQKCRQDPTLGSSIIALCGRYLTADDAQALFGLSSGRAVFRHYMYKARTLVKAVSDEPSVAHIQASLILALTELLSDSGSRHWLFAGMAIRMAEIMRLNKEFHQKHSLKEQEIRRRTFWACLLFDRVLAYFLAKHRTIHDDTISIAVPGTDLSILYQEETRAITLNGLAAYRHPSDLGLSSYLIKTVCVWSDLADFAAYSRRRLEPHPPTDPRSAFLIRSDALRAWTDSLPQSLRWGVQNYRNHQALGQARTFVGMQFVLHGASCIAHQCYLPHPTLYTKLVDLVDAAGWSYLFRDEMLVGTCVSNALAIGEILDYLMDPQQGNDQVVLQTIWVAASTLTAANVFLWIQYAQDETYSTNELRQKAAHYYNLIHQLTSSWVSEWDVSGQWLLALDVMHDLYKAAYLGEVNERILRQDNTHSPRDNDNFRPQPGDGYPTLITLPNLQASIKFATCDTSARSINIPAIWLQLSGGWPYGYAGPESEINLPMEAQFTGSVDSASSV